MMRPTSLPVAFFMPFDSSVSLTSLSSWSLLMAAGFLGMNSASMAASSSYWSARSVRGGLAERNVWAASVRREMASWSVLIGEGAEPAECDAFWRSARTDCARGGSVSAEARAT